MESLVHSYKATTFAQQCTTSLNQWESMGFPKLRLSKSNPERLEMTQRQLPTSEIHSKKVCFKEDYTVEKTQKRKCKLKFSFTTLVS